MNRIREKISLLALVVIIAALSVYRISCTGTSEITWDVLGYYLPLPATFIYHDPLMKNTEWIKKVNDEKHLTGTLYMISSNDKGEPMYFFLFGMALFYLPFFLTGHIGAHLLKLPADGFSPPYQYALVAGGIIYMIVGLIFFRKNLKRFFPEGITALVMLVVVFATNYIHHLTVKSLEPVCVLFMLVNIVIYYTIRWHEEYRARHLFFILAGITLMALVKPSEIIIAVLPLLWNVTSFRDFREKARLIFSKRMQFFLAGFVCFLFILPQILYWYMRTGHLVYDSYKNPGVGLDLLRPHIGNVLFSFRKGWLVYTPVMVFSFPGLFLVYRNNRKIFLSLVIYFLAAFYIISSWTEWWYGAGFSNRPLITLYPVLAVALGYFFIYTGKQKLIVKSIIAVLIVFFTFLNQFQWWQLRHYILDPYRTTRKYYMATFLRTSVSSADGKLLLVNRDFSGEMSFMNPGDYSPHLIKDMNFDGFRPCDEGHVVNEAGNNFYRLTDKQEFALTNQIPYKDLTEKDHLWVVVCFDLRYPAGFKDTWPCFVITMNRKEGDYGYYAPDIKPDSLTTGWKSYRFEFLTPEVRSKNDLLKYYFWKRGPKGFDIDKLKVTVFERKQD